MDNLHSGALCWNAEVFSELHCGLRLFQSPPPSFLPHFTGVRPVSWSEGFPSYSLVLILHRFHLCNNIPTWVTMARKTLFGTFVIDVNIIIIGRAQAQLLIQQRQLGIRVNEKNEESQWMENY